MVIKVGDKWCKTTTTWKFWWNFLAKSLIFSHYPSFSPFERPDAYKSYTFSESYGSRETREIKISTSKFDLEARGILSSLWTQTGPWSDTASYGGVSMTIHIVFFVCSVHNFSTHNNIVGIERWNHWFFWRYYICLLKEGCNFKSSKQAAILLRVGVRLGNGSVGLQLDQTVSSLLHNLCLFQHVEAGVKLSVGQRLLIAPFLLLHLLCGPDKVADQLDRLPFWVVTLKAGVDQLAEVVEPLAVNSKLHQTVALWPVVDGGRGTTEKGKDNIPFITRKIDAKHLSMANICPMRVSPSFLLGRCISR